VTGPQGAHGFNSRTECYSAQLTNNTNILNNTDLNYNSNVVNSDSGGTVFSYDPSGKLTFLQAGTVMVTAGFTAFDDESIADPFITLYRVATAVDRATLHAEASSSVNAAMWIQLRTTSFIKVAAGDHIRVNFTGATMAFGTRYRNGIDSTLSVIWMGDL
jgi:hypothetical protein